MRISDWSSDVCSSDLVYPDCLHPLQRTRDVRSGAKSLFDKNAAADGQHGLFPPLEGSGFISRTGGVQEQPVSRTFLSNTVSRLEDHTSELTSLMSISYADFGS